jgi:hypothetical protein
MIFGKYLFHYGLPGFLPTLVQTIASFHYVFRNECCTANTDMLDRDGFVKGMWRIDQELRQGQMNTVSHESVILITEDVGHQPEKLLSETYSNGTGKQNVKDSDIIIPYVLSL